MIFKKRKKLKKRRKKSKKNKSIVNPIRLKPWPNIELILDEHIPNMVIDDFDKLRPKTITHITNGMSDRDLLNMVIQKAQNSPRHFIILTSDKSFIFDSGWMDMILNSVKPNNVSVVDLTKFRSVLKTAAYGQTKKPINKSSTEIRKKVVKSVVYQFMQQTFINA